ncbi:hypothetical protein SLEP1_g23031 [Rubroshorea leprosula]|uniref:Oxidative stress 3 n=1 Tax=Rubroshorea leprosula TaxID=152421 RepID=A0AAV5JGD9_9ROSI|nr:hypothetical protein SLEP1_g23031 [Rubroshorea leprosula]
MGGEERQIFQGVNMKKTDAEISDEIQMNKWDVCMETGDDNPVSNGSSPADSENSISSALSSSDLVEDASSTACSSSSSSSNGPLYELSELMAQLPIKRGLSKYYEGKCQSFTSLASVKSVEDLVKKGNNPYNKTKMKSCKSFGWGLEGQNNRVYSPKATISKKGSRGSCFLSSSSLAGKRGSLVNVNVPFQSSS